MSQLDKIAFERERLNRAMLGSIEHRRHADQGKAVLQLAFEEIERLRGRITSMTFHLSEIDWTLRGYYDPEMIALREAKSAANPEE